MASPAYDPGVIRELASSAATRAITVTAEDGCFLLGLTLEDVWTTLRELDGPRCRFHKAMPSEREPTESFDVYDAFVGPHAIYLKFKVVERAHQRVVVVSFKRNEHY